MRWCDYEIFSLRFGVLLPRHGATEAMAKQVARGVAHVEGVEARLRTVPLSVLKRSAPLWMMCLSRGPFTAVKTTCGTARPGVG